MGSPILRRMQAALNFRHSVVTDADLIFPHRLIAQTSRSSRRGVSA